MRGALRRRVAAAAAAAVTLVLGACTAIPTSGPVQQGGDGRVDEPSNIDVLAEGPRPDAAPLEIVESFLVAGSAGFRDDFVVARQYLAGEARAEWQPLAGVVVSGALEFGDLGDGQVQVDVPVVARVDREGRYAEAPAGAESSVTFGLVQDDEGQWRISEAPDGLVVPTDDFEVFFRQTSIYFLSPDETFLVPEQRWLPVKSRETSVVSALLAGPSPWLRDAVHTALPDGVQLKPEAVSVDAEGVAHVGLFTTRTAELLDADRPLLLAQIEQSLLALPGVSSVDVTAGGVSLDGAASLRSGEGPAVAPEVLLDGALVQVGTDGPAPVDGLGPLTVPDPSAPARDEGGTVRVVLSDGRSLVTVPTEDDPGTTLYTGSALSAPSVDRHGYAWTTDVGAGIVAVLASRATGEAPAQAVQVAAPALEGRTVRSVRVSRDGVRVALVSTGDDGVAVHLGAVTRDRHGVPQAIGEVVRVGTPLTAASSVVWFDEATLGVLATEGGESVVHVVPLAGETTTLPRASGLVSLAGGRTPYAATADGTLLRLVGTTWVRVPDVAGVRDPSLPG
ncbi:LpqB family beta-propeller domain-containing protein [Cellulomonas algicola]|uniref:LpqB family beta-propeller domain-containing protein n=1 Tax=Cellulomonas algicola TaxID=2071633 RepID=UPI001C3F895B|nr:LpqB family beta-propeller domain-containing protein [Cellulomonas algicola]